MKTKRMIMICLIGAIYTAISLLMAPLSYAGIQIRLAEALNMIVLVYPAGGYGVILGCFLTNLIGAMQGLNVLGLIDSVVGTIATAIAVYLAYRFRNVRYKKIPWLSMLCIVLVNGIIIGMEMTLVLMKDNMFYGFVIFALEIMVSEVISVLIGYWLVNELDKRSVFEGK